MARAWEHQSQALMEGPALEPSLCAELRWAEHYFHAAETIITFSCLFLGFLMHSVLQNFLVLVKTILNFILSESLELSVQKSYLQTPSILTAPVIIWDPDIKPFCTSYLPCGTSVIVGEILWASVYRLCEGYMTVGSRRRRISHCGWGYTCRSTLCHSLGFINTTLTSQLSESTQFINKFHMDVGTLRGQRWCHIFTQSVVHQLSSLPVIVRLYSSSVGRGGMKMSMRLFLR